MNTYQTKFIAECPANGARILYDLTISTGVSIMVEDINEFLSEVTSDYHESIADRLFEAFGGQQVLKADHHGVSITTIRPFLAHWSRDEPAKGGGNG